MPKQVWEGVHNPDQPYVPINEAPDKRPTLNPEERVILMDLYEKGLLEGEDREIAEEMLGIVTDERPRFGGAEPGIPVDYLDSEEYQKNEEDIREIEAEHEYDKMDAYEEKLSPAQRKDLSGVRMLLRETKKSHRGDKKRNWKSFPNSSRSSIRKPSADGDVQLRDGVQ